ncbi:3-dehydroquinate synthase [Tanticharoenia sakaeratensis]
MSAPSTIEEPVGPMPDDAIPEAGTRTIVLVGLMGAGKTTIGRRLAARLNLPFVDADAEIERAAGCTIPELFARHGEAAFRDGERRVLRRLLLGPRCVLSTGGGAFMDAGTRALIKERALSVWLRVSLPVLLKRVTGRQGRPLLAGRDPHEVMTSLMALRHPIYAEADLIVDCGDDSIETGAQRVLRAIQIAEPARVPVDLPGERPHRYDVVIGPDLLERAGALLGPILPQKRCVIVTDERVAALHLPALLRSLGDAGIRTDVLRIPGGESSKSLAQFSETIEALLALRVERRTAVIGFGGGVVGDLAGFLAASALRGLPFVQIPTTLLSQVDSSVGGKTGINSASGKNLIGAFHQPLAVLADSDVLGTLTRRELGAGYAEILKAGLISDPALFGWCENHAGRLLDGESATLIEAVRRACAFKAQVVAADEHEQAADGGRALLNLGHSFAHALEAEFHYDGRLLHGEAVGIGLVLAAALSERLGYCPPLVSERVSAHLRSLGLMAGLDDLPHRLSAARLIEHMKGDKKMRDGRLSFVLLHGIGRAFTSRAVGSDDVLALLLEQGCDA